MVFDINDLCVIILIINIMFGESAVTEYIVFIPLVIMLAGLTPIVMIDKFISKKQKRLLLIIIAFVALLLLKNCGDYICQMTDMPSQIYRTLLDILGS